MLAGELLEPDEGRDVKHQGRTSAAPPLSFVKREITTSIRRHRSHVSPVNSTIHLQTKLGESEPVKEFSAAALFRAQPLGSFAVVGINYISALFLSELGYPGMSIRWLANCFVGSTAIDVGLATDIAALYERMGCRDEAMEMLRGVTTPDTAKLVQECVAKDSELDQLRESPAFQNFAPASLPPPPARL